MQEGSAGLRRARPGCAGLAKERRPGRAPPDICLQRVISRKGNYWSPADQSAFKAERGWAGRPARTHTHARCRCAHIHSRCEPSRARPADRARSGRTGWAGLACRPTRVRAPRDRQAEESVCTFRVRARGRCAPLRQTCGARYANELLIALVIKPPAQALRKPFGIRQTRRENKSFANVVGSLSPRSRGAESARRSRPHRPTNYRATKTRAEKIKQRAAPGRCSQHALH